MHISTELRAKVLAFLRDVRTITPALDRDAFELERIFTPKKTGRKKGWRKARPLDLDKEKKLLDIPR